MLIDTHCHLNFQVFEKNVDLVINEAKKAGVEKIIVPGADLASSLKAVELAQKYSSVYAAVGIHPHHTRDIKTLDIKILREELTSLAKNKKVVGIGECGLDYYQYQKTKYENYQISDDFKQEQKELFIMQIKLAFQLKLPLIIHNREATQDILIVLNQCIDTSIRGVFHCFEGDKEILAWVLEHSFLLGITGNVTYNQKVQQAVKTIPLTKLVVETDAPYLLPEPLRAQKSFPNQPKNVKIVVQGIAKLKSDSFLNIVKQTTDNARKLFKIK